MKTLKQLFLESIISGTFDEYYDALLSSYKLKFKNEEDADTFIEFLKMNDEEASSMLNLELKIEKEDNGTLIIAYGEKEDNIILFGIVSTEDKMNRTDLSAINSWIDRLIEKMKEGKQLVTHPHELSIKMLKHIENKCKNIDGYIFNKKLGNKVNLKDVGFEMKDERYSTFQSVTLSLTKK